LKQTAIILMAGALLAGCAVQQPAAPLIPAELANPAPAPVHVPDDPLNALSPAIREAYLSGSARPGRDGISWVFPYEATGRPTIYTSPLHLTEIVLADDEHLTNAAIGDSDRFDLDARGRRILIKPTPFGHNQGGSYNGNTTVMVPLTYSTNLVAETDKRSYHFIVQSTPHTWMEQVWQSDQGVPRVDPLAAGAWYSEWLMVEQPEQSKYTAALTLFWQDNLKDEDDYAFVPALRRSLRLSSTARCAPLLGSDMVKDDQRVGWNGGVGKFVGKWLRDQKLLTLEEMNGQAAGTFPGEYDGVLGWPKPSWGDWETRDTYVVDVRRIPELAPGYCYGSRVDYVDKQYYTNIAEDIYDTNLKLWKVVWVGQSPTQLDNYGEQPAACGIVETYWDVQNDHVSYVTSFNPKGTCVLNDSKVPPQWNNVRKYATPAGLNMLMQ
jgi:Conjugal transfer protein/Protein of unknown function (DUF1329)